MEALAQDRFLFRGISTRTKNWVEGCYFRDVDRDAPSALSEFAHRIQPLYSQAWAHPVWPETISQYTGVPDKNGKKIFEYDVVKDSHGRCYKIVYDIEEGSYMMADKTGSLYGIGTVNSNKFEVVGNIFDNPEYGFSLDHEKEIER